MKELQQKFMEVIKLMMQKGAAGRQTIANANAEREALNLVEE